MPPLPPKSNLIQASTSKLKFNPQNLNKKHEMNDKTLVEDQIEEDINPYADYILEDDGNDEDEFDLYQAPVSGGIPIRLCYNIDSSQTKRPFTPPFQQIVKMQQLGNSKLAN